MTATRSRGANILSWLKNNLAALLVLLALALFVSKSLYNYPVGIMAVLGLYRFIRAPKQLWEHVHGRIILSLFLCLWLPMLFALPDAVSFEHSLETVLGYIRFLFMGVYLLTELKTPGAKNFLLVGIFFLVSFWCIDATVQVLFSINLFGYPYEERHITGMFYPKNTIAHICAGLSPLYFELIRQKYRQNKSVLLLLFPLFIVILLSGRRAAWIMLFVSVSGYLGFYIMTRTSAAISAKQVLLPGLVMFAILATVAITHEPTNRKIKTTLGLFSYNYETVDQATARRLPLWFTSLRMAKDHWINGVGPRGYRHAYSDFTNDDDYWKESGQTHPHQLLLEVLTESGVIGLLGLLLFLLIFYRFAVSSAVEPPLFPWAWAVLVVIFPINTHMAFYGAYWSSFFWLLLASCLVAASPATRETVD